MQLWVGLGNPGAQYALHRHNVGFMAVDLIADVHNFSPWSKKFRSLVAEGRIGRHKVLLLKPQTFMNDSGDAVQQALRFYKLELDLGLVHRGPTPATTDNTVFIPPKARVDLGGHYRFKLAKRSATFRLQLVNLFNNAGYGLGGSGIYTSNMSRNVQGYLTVDF